MDLFAMSDSFGKLLKSYRKQANLTLVELARETTLSNAYLSKLENNKSTPTTDTLKKICNVLDENNSENLYEKLLFATGKTHSVEKDSEIYKGLKKQGRIYENQFGVIKVLEKPYQKLNYLLESESPIIYDIKKEAEGEPIASIQLTPRLKNQIYNAINRIVIDELIQNPKLVHSINDERILTNHVDQQEKNLHELVSEIGDIPFEDLLKLIDDDENFL